MVVESQGGGVESTANIQMTHRVDKPYNPHTGDEPGARARACA